MRKFFAIIFVLLMVQPAHAVIEGGNAGAINRNYAEQIKKHDVEREFIETTPEDLEKEKKQREEEEKKFRDVKKGDVIYNPKFEFKDVEFEGNTIYSDDDLKSLGQDILGKQIYLEDVMDYVVAISRHYQKNGYITTYAYIPEQEVEGGVIKIVVLESRISKKNVTGNFWVRKFYITNILTGCRKMKVGAVFNAKPFQGVVKKINREPYMNTIIAIEKEGDDTVVDFDIKDRAPLMLNTSWDDFGRDLIGRQRWSAILGSQNLTGLGDKIYGGPILSRHSQAAIAGYELPISPCGTTLGFEFSGVKVKPQGDFSELGLRGTSRFFTLIAKHPFINSVDTDLIGYAAWDWIDTNTTIALFDEPLVTYALRVPRVGANFVRDDLTGRWISNVEAAFGIDGVGSTGNVPGGPQTSFQRYTASVIRVQKLPKNILGILRVNGQYSPQSLFPAMQMYLGGPYNIWGFQPSELLGDWGVAGGEELRFPVPGLRKILPEKIKHLDDRIKLTAFHNWGFTRQNADVGEAPKNFIQSVGFGAYINILDNLNVLIGVGFPLGSKFFDQKSARMFFSVNTDLDRFLKPRTHKRS